MDEARGQEAESPWQVSARGWMDILKRAWKTSAQRNLSLVAGGVAYYVLIALFPALAALVSVYGLVANPADAIKHAQAFSGMLPASAVTSIGTELRQLTAASSKSLGLGAVIGFFTAVWSALRGMSGMISALNIAYGQPERRGFLRLTITGVLLTSVVVIGGLIALALIVALPIVLHQAGISEPRRWIGLTVEWPLLVLFFAGLIALIYRYGPDRDVPKWKWASPGVIAATMLWMIGSGLFSLYIDKFSSYDKTYGALGALLVLLIWLWLSAFVVLLGAEINGEAERQTRRETSVA
jgi:membrane protein